MDDRKWLRRKYPEVFDEVNSFLDDHQLSEFKKRKYNLGRLVSDMLDMEDYSAGTMIMFKRSNPVRDYNYPMHYAVIKCSDGITASGYLSMSIYERDFKEIHPALTKTKTSMNGRKLYREYARQVHKKEAESFVSIETEYYQQDQLVTKDSNGNIEKCTIDYREMVNWIIRTQNLK